MALQDSFIKSAGAITGFGKGFSDELAELAQRETSEQAAFLSQFNTPQEAMQALEQQGVSGLGDVVYGLGGFIPGSNLAAEGAAWQAFFGNADQYTQQQLAQNQGMMNQQLALQQQGMANDLAQAQMRMSVSAAQNAAQQRAAQAEAEGLSANEARLGEQWRAEFEREGEWRQQDIEMAQMEAQGKLEEEAAAAKQEARQTFAMLVAMGIPPKEAKALAGLGAGGVKVGEILAGQAEETEEEAEAAAAATTGKRDDMWAAMGDEYTWHRGDTKKEAFNAIKGSLQARWENFAGVKEGRVDARINKYINANWETWKSGGAGAGGAGGKDRNEWLSTQANRSYDDWKDWTELSELGRPPAGAPKGMWQYSEAGAQGTQKTWRINYDWAYKRIYNHMVAEDEKWVKAHPRMVKNKINTFLSSQGITRRAGAAPRTTTTTTGRTTTTAPRTIAQIRQIPAAQRTAYQKRRLRRAG